MPLILPPHFPAVELLKKQGLPTEPAVVSMACNAAPLRIAIVNLMPLKIDTEVDLVRVMWGYPLDVELHWVQMSGHESRHTPKEHMDAYYDSSEQIRKQAWDGLIVTGAPVEQLMFEQVDYWKELQQLMDWAHSHVPSTMYICWGAQAALYHFFGIGKYELSQKLFGIFPQKVINNHPGLLTGLGEEFLMPHSRHTAVDEAAVAACDALIPLAHGVQTGTSMLMTDGCRELFVTGHLEYDRHTLGKEYMRDRGKRTDVALPQNYFPNNDLTAIPHSGWYAAAHIVYHNWLTWCVAAHKRTVESI